MPSCGDCWQIHMSSESKASQDLDTWESCNPVKGLIFISSKILSPVLCSWLRTHLPVQVRHVEHNGCALVLSPLVRGDLTPALNVVMTRAEKLKCAGCPSKKLPFVEGLF